MKKQKITDVPKSKKVKATLSASAKSKLVKEDSKILLKEFNKAMIALSDAHFENTKALIEKSLFLNGKHEEEFYKNILSKYTEQLAKEEAKRVQAERRSALDSVKDKVVLGLSKDIQQIDFIDLASNVNDFVKLYQKELKDSDVGKDAELKIQNEFMSSISRLSKLLDTPESNRNDQQKAEIDEVLAKIDSIEDGSFFTTSDGQVALSNIISDYKNSQAYRNSLLETKSELMKMGVQRSAEKMDKQIKNSLIAQLILSPDKALKMGLGKIFNSKNGIFGKASIALKNIADTTTIMLTPWMDAIKTSLAGRAVTKSYAALKAFLSGSFLKSITSVVGDVLGNIFSIRNFIKMLQSPMGLVLLAIFAGFFSGYIMPRLQKLYDNYIKPSLTFLTDKVWPFLVKSFDYITSKVMPFLTDTVWPIIKTVGELVKKIYDVAGWPGLALLAAAIWSAPALASMLTTFAGGYLTKLIPAIMGSAAMTAAMDIAIAGLMGWAVGTSIRNILNRATEGKYDEYIEKMWGHFFDFMPKWFKNMVGIDDTGTQNTLSGKNIELLQQRNKLIDAVKGRNDPEQTKKLNEYLPDAQAKKIPIKQQIEDIYKIAGKKDGAIEQGYQMIHGKEAEVAAINANNTASTVLEALKTDSAINTSSTPILTSAKTAAKDKKQPEKTVNNVTNNHVTNINLPSFSPGTAPFSTQSQGATIY